LFSFLKFSQLSSIHLFLKIFFFCKDGEQTKVEKAKQIYILPKFSDFFCVVYYSFNYGSFLKTWDANNASNAKCYKYFFKSFIKFTRCMMKNYTHEEMQVQVYIYSQICLRNASQRKYLPFISNHASLINIHKQNIRKKNLKAKYINNKKIT
jgi:hypothetical protein